MVRDPEIRSLSGRYLYGDYCTGALHALRRGAQGGVLEDRSLGLIVPRLTTFGEAYLGHIYVASWKGQVYRLRANP